MQVGWQGIARTIAVTAAVTSAFWVVLGSWLFDRHLGERPDDRLVMRPAPARQDRQAMLPASRAEGRIEMTLPARASVPLEVIPVAGIAATQLVDTFSQSRADGARRHDALDIPAPLGTPVVAAMPGRVEKLWLSPDGGNTVYLRSRNGRVIAYYAHLDRYAPGLAEGQELEAGALIGAVGATGNANPEAPHLHFAVWQTAPDRRWSEPATAVNPYPLLTALRPAGRQGAERQGEAGR